MLTAGTNYTHLLQDIYAHSQVVIAEFCDNDDGGSGGNGGGDGVDDNDDEDDYDGNVDAVASCSILREVELDFVWL